jgi:hypothetical protein
MPRKGNWLPRALQTPRTCGLFGKLSLSVFTVWTGSCWPRHMGSCDASLPLPISLEHWRGPELSEPFGEFKTLLAGMREPCWPESDVKRRAATTFLR